MRVDRRHSPTARKSEASKARSSCSLAALRDIKKPAKRKAINKSDGKKAAKARFSKTASVPSEKALSKCSAESKQNLSATTRKELNRLKPGRKKRPSKDWKDVTQVKKSRQQILSVPPTDCLRLSSSKTAKSCPPQQTIEEKTEGSSDVTSSWSIQGSTTCNFIPAPPPYSFYMEAASTTDASNFSGTSTRVKHQEPPLDLETTIPNFGSFHTSFVNSTICHSPVDCKFRPACLYSIEDVDEDEREPCSNLQCHSLSEKETLLTSQEKNTWNHRFFNASPQYRELHHFGIMTPSTKSSPSYRSGTTDARLTPLASMVHSCPSPTMFEPLFDCTVSSSDTSLFSSSLVRTPSRNDESAPKRISGENGWLLAEDVTAV